MADEPELSFEDVQPHCADCTIEKKIGVGGQKEVFKARDKDGNPLVIKFVRIEYKWSGSHTVMHDVDTEKRALREVELMKSYASLYLPALYDESIEYVKINGYVYVMYKEQFAGSESLADLIKSQGSIGEKRVMQVVQDVATALSLYDKDDIVHRDVKPQNIVFNEATDSFVLIDGGIHLSPLHTTLSVGYVAGTELYFSPEQAKGKRRELDSRSDMFSLGIIAHEALTGFHPFTIKASSREQFASNRNNSLFPPLSHGMYKGKTVAVITRLLEKYPHNRYRNPDALLLEFKEEE